MGARKPKVPRGRPLRAPHHVDAPEASTDARKAVYAIIDRALTATRDQGGAAFESALDELTTAPDELVDASIVEITEHILGAIWKRGWQPLDVARTVSKGPHTDWLRDMVAGQIGTYPADRIHDRWSAQLVEMRADVWWAGDAYAHLRLWSEQWGMPRVEALRIVLEVVGEINYLPDLPLLMPPPGQARRGTLSPDARAADSRMLGKIRGLLAKAESTKFPAEAESYSAKAQELMARHAIDHALIAGQIDDPDKPVGVRITIDKPYAESKAVLLQQVAEANLCRSVWSPDYEFSTVFGYAPDLDVVEMMFLSLLVQGSAAMIREGSTSKESPDRTRAFRQSFMQAYASRIGERLGEVSAAAMADAAQDDDRLLPVLASREKAVDERMRALFPVSTRGTIRVRDERGWVSGRAAADRAALRGQDH